MEFIVDMLLLAATLGATVYCCTLARRLRQFTRLETGMGGAIAVLSAEVDAMTRALARAQSVASDSREDLAGLTQRAEALARRLELLVASMHDLPEVRPEASGAGEGPAPRRRMLRRRAPRREASC